MRRLLVASAALLGFAGAAHAAGLIEMNPTTSPPSVGDATGVTTTPPKTGWNAPDFNPDPGKVIIRLDALLAWDVGATGGTLNRGTVYTAGVPTGTGKSDPFQMSGYFRLYFGVDGKLLNGMLWGAQSEMRTNFAGEVPPGYEGTGAFGSPGGNATATTYYVRRAYGYIGTPAWGLIRFGQGDGPLSLFTTPGITTGEAFSTGAWDGDVPDLMPGNASPGWFFNDVSGEYATNKIVYLSPTWFGLNASVSFAPNESNLAVTECSNSASGNCYAQASSVNAADQSHWRNEFEAAVRYQANFGPVALDSMFGGQISGRVNQGIFGAAETHKNVNAIDGGASLTFMGASVFGHVYGGQVNGLNTQVTIGPRGAPKGWDWTAGAQYTIGPWTAGASYYYVNNEGTSTGLNNQTFRAEAVGGTYNWAPGFNTFLEYLHGERHQAGVDFVNSGGPSTIGNNVSSNGIALTMLIQW